uniref:Uncharacterized protein n=1 Tax=Hyaloperonospora arabidopsidis (strain Emoy2) TaxID=559515 RepID=M4BMU3_HYAAE
MDTGKSTQVLAKDFAQLTPTWQVFLDSLKGDINHWISIHSPTDHPAEDDGRLQT